MRPEGIEPPAYRFEACRSIHLSYGRTLEIPDQDYLIPGSIGHDRVGSILGSDVLESSFASVAMEGAVAHAVPPAGR